MNKTNLRVGNYIELKGNKYVIAKIDFAWYHPDDGWQIEFTDATGQTINWKQWCDGGKMVDCPIDYKTRDDVFGEINLLIKRQAAAIERASAEPDSSPKNILVVVLEHRLQCWNDLLDDMTAIGEYVKDKTPVVVQCEDCQSWHPVFLDDLVGYVAHGVDWLCDSCVNQSFYDNDPANYYDEDDDDDDDYEDDDWEPSPEDIRDAASNMPCDNCGYCIGMGCYDYYKCNGFK